MTQQQIPPHSPATEAAVLGALLNEGCNLDAVRAMLPLAKCFYLPEHAAVYKAMLDIANAGGLVDVITVDEQLRRNRQEDAVGGAHALMQLSNGLTSAAHVEAHAMIVREKYMARELMRLCTESAANMAGEKEDVLAHLDKLSAALHNLTLNLNVKDPAHISDAWQRSMAKIEELINSPYEYTGVPSGFEKLDKITSGWQPGDMIIVCADSSVGKTAFALNLALNAASHPEKPTPVAFFSLEMNDISATNRVQANVCDVSMYNIRNPKSLTQEQKQRLNASARHIAGLPLYLDTPANMTMFEFRAKLRQMRQKRGLGLVIVDYLQFLKTNTRPNDNREQEVSKISRELKETAKEFDVPIIAISSTNRQGQTRDSGNIDFDADLKIQLKKPSEQDVKESGISPDHRMIDIVKHRNGETIELPMFFMKDVQRFIEYEREMFNKTTK